MNTRHRLQLAATLVVCLMVGTAQAETKAPPPDPTSDPLMVTAGFLSYHPDLRFRMRGLEKYNAGKLEDAFGLFRLAAYYADKPSQGMVAEMLWSGQGVPQDRALAYAWMDLAAERGYRGFLGLRERYWNELTEQERERAIAEGQAVYAKYGDAAAKPRIASKLRQGRRNVAGSRTGFTGALQIHVPGPGGEAVTIDGSKFHDQRYWDPDQYQAWHDSVWMRPRIGRVSVGEMEQVDAAGVEHPAGSRIPEAAPDHDAEEPPNPVADEP